MVSTIAFSARGSAFIDLHSSGLRVQTCQISVSKHQFIYIATSPPLQRGLSVCGCKVKNKYWIREILLREICIFLIVWAHKKENLRGIWDSTEVFCLISCVCWATRVCPVSLRPLFVKVCRLFQRIATNVWNYSYFCRQFQFKRL